MTLQVTLVPSPNRGELERDWRALEAKADGGFFLSWTWIAAWLEALAAEVFLARVHDGGRLVGLGLFTQKQARRLGAIAVRQLILHASGDADLDRIEIEYNGMLAERGRDDEILLAVLDHVRTGPWDEWLLPGVPEGLLPGLRAHGFASHVSRRSSSYAVPLDSDDLIAALSSNSRAQLRRALRLAGSEGPLTLEPAGNVEQAFEFLDRMKELDRWASLGREGAFATGTRYNFHRGLIRRGMATAEVELLEARAGYTRIGFLYQFLHRGRVMAYQAAYPRPADNRHRPGLVMHYLAMERARAAGFKVYDFLAGEARYKRSFAQPDKMLVWCRLREPGLISFSEEGLRRLAASVRRSLPFRL